MFGLLARQRKSVRFTAIAGISLLIAITTYTISMGSLYVIQIERLVVSWQGTIELDESSIESWAVIRVTHGFGAQPTRAEVSFVTGSDWTSLPTIEFSQLENPASDLIPNQYVQLDDAKREQLVTAIRELASAMQASSPAVTQLSGNARYGGLDIKYSKSIIYPEYPGHVIISLAVGTLSGIVAASFLSIQTKRVVNQP